MVTTNSHDASFPLLSTAVQLTAVCPISKGVSDAGVHDTCGTTPELSDGDGDSHTTTAVDCPVSVLLAWLSGQSSRGISLSVNDVCEPCFFTG